MASSSIVTVLQTMRESFSLAKPAQAYAGRLKEDLYTSEEWDTVTLENKRLERGSGVLFKLNILNVAVYDEPRDENKLSKTRVVMFSGKSAGICRREKSWPVRTKVRMEAASASLERRVGNTLPSSSWILRESVPDGKTDTFKLTNKNKSLTRTLGEILVQFINHVVINR